MWGPDRIAGYLSHFAQDPGPLGLECPPTQRPHITLVHITHSSSKMSPLADTQEHRVTHEAPPQPSGLSPIVVIGSHRDSHQRRSWRLDQRLGRLGGWNHRHPVQRPTIGLYSSCAKRTQNIIKNKRILLPPRSCFPLPQKCLADIPGV